MYNDTDIPNTYQCILAIAGQVSVFQEKYSTQKDWKQEGAEDGSIKINKAGEFEPYLKIDHAKKELLFFEELGDNTVLVKDNYPHLKWNISSETKKIAGYNCTKATTEYRGRTWEAWFTPEIALSFGPWKLEGLPGLILEATDSTRKYMYKATKIELKKSDVFNKDFALLMPTYNKTPIPYQQYLKDHEEYWTNRRKSLAQAANATITMNIVPRSGMELKYEWEK